MSFISKVMEDKDSFDFRGHSDGILLLLFVSKHCSEKWELKISAFGLKIYNKNVYIYFHEKFDRYLFIV